MIIDLQRREIINMVKGMDPSYKYVDHPIAEQNGYYTGGFCDKWEWSYDSEFVGFTDEELWDFYILLRDRYDD